METGRRHGWKDLVTPHEAIRKGFLDQALQKTKEAAPYIEEARQFAHGLKIVTEPADLVAEEGLKSYLIAAAGFSEKSTAHLSVGELDDALLDVLSSIAERTGQDWKEELLFRFLLTRGDALGGRVRNLTGAAASRQFVSVLRARLANRRIATTVDETSIKTKSVNWGERVLLFDRKPKLIGNNVDVILLRRAGEKTSLPALLAEGASYVACGELKGGIDPAGADEHWKTANSALARIRARFARKRPQLFFAGAVIEEAMAKELMRQLRGRKLDFAANLTSPDQVVALADWLVGL